LIVIHRQEDVMNKPLENIASSGLYQAQYGQFIGGQWVEGASGATIDLFNPATGQVLSRIAAGNAQDVERAVAAASEAFKTWGHSTPAERQEVLVEIARRLKARAQDFALLETLNNGKPIRESLHFDVPTAISQFEMFAGAAWHLDGRAVDYPDALGVVHREPYGVVAQIIPWNVPLIMMASKIAPALAAGNTIVLKPAETVCLSVLEFFREMQDVIPPGVVNVVTGFGADVGEPLVTHPLVRKVAFTGSIPTARRIMQYASVNVIPQTLELGGKSAHIVFEDADIDAAVESAAMSTVFNKGEVCLAGTRLLLQESIRDEFLEKLARTLDAVRLGDPTDPATQMGAQASVMQRDKVLSYLELGVKEGAKVYRGGKRASVPGLENGNFIEPTIFTDVDNRMRIAQEEIFGPVTCAITFKTDEDAIRIANDSAYGLGGGLWTRDLGRAHRVSRAMQTGTIWVNRYFNMKPGMPVGGYKQSGFGREFCFDILEHYTLTKSVIINLDERPLGVFQR
jgi:acyl-CoA reductase-like NAD-dependent aldehyde dehydrogenase